MISSRYSKLTILTILMVGIFFSCKNDMKIVKELSSNDNGPSQIIEDGEYIFTEKGKLKNKLSAGVMKQYRNDTNYISIEDGLKMEIYDSKEIKTAQLTSKSGLYFDKIGRMEAIDSVVLANTKGETLTTDKLIWLQDSAIIYSDLPIVIHSGDNIIYGDGIVSNESFTRRTITNPRGQLEIKTDNNESK